VSVGAKNSGNVAAWPQRRPRRAHRREHRVDAVLAVAQLVADGVTGVRHLPGTPQGQRVCKVPGQEAAMDQATTKARSGTTSGPNKLREGRLRVAPVPVLHPMLQVASLAPPVPAVFPSLLLLRSRP
jgi:hypothetical protein